MRRSYVLAMAVISVYCLTDAFASSPGEPAGKRVFTAEIVDAPIATVQTNDARRGMQASAAAVIPEGISPAAELVAETARPAMRPASHSWSSRTSISWTAPSRWRSATSSTLTSRSLMAVDASAAPVAVECAPLDWRT